MLVVGLLLMPFVLGDLPDAKWQRVGRGIASAYRPWQKSRTVPYARYPGNWSVKPTRVDLVCAHRTLPFWTLLRLKHKGRAAYCVVLDRGPYGFCQRVGDRKKRTGCKRGHRYIVKTRVRQKLPGYYRGIIDATIAVHRVMGSRGWVTVTVERLASRERKRRVLRLAAPSIVYPPLQGSSRTRARWTALSVIQR